jgi:hypothetical protein
MTRISVLIAALLLWSVPAQAYPCWVIRRAVAQHGEVAVDSWARANGVIEKKSKRPGDA